MPVQSGGPQPASSGAPARLALAGDDQAKRGDTQRRSRRRLQLSEQNRHYRSDPAAPTGPLRRRTCSLTREMRLRLWFRLPQQPCYERDRATDTSVRTQRSRRVDHASAVTLAPASGAPEKGNSRRATLRATSGWMVNRIRRLTCGFAALPVDARLLVRRAAGAPCYPPRVSSARSGSSAQQQSARSHRRTTAPRSTMQPHSAHSTCTSSVVQEAAATSGDGDVWLPVSVIPFR